MVGLFAASFSSYPLTFSFVGQAEAPQGMADVLEARGEPNFTLRLFVYRESHLPVMVSWQAPPPSQGRGPGGRGPGAAGSPSPAAPAQAPGQRASQATPPENRIYFADYREVDGLKLPFRLRRAIGPDTVEETTFDRFRINTKIDPKKFEIRK